MEDSFRFFLESNFLRVNRLFVLVYPNRNDESKKIETRNYLKLEYYVLAIERCNIKIKYEKR